MNLTKEKRWLAEGLNEICEVDAVVQEDGKIFMYSYDGQEFFRPSSTDYLSTSKEEAEEYAKSIIPENAEQVKNYLRLLHEQDNDEELEKFLPNPILKCYKEHFSSAISFAYCELQQVKSAIGGIINIGGYSFRPDMIHSVRYIGNKSEDMIVILTNGKEIPTRNTVERIIIKAVVCDNYSGLHFKK